MYDLRNDPMPDLWICSLVYWPCIVFFLSSSYSRDLNLFCLLKTKYARVINIPTTIAPVNAVSMIKFSTGVLVSGLQNFKLTKLCKNLQVLTLKMLRHMEDWLWFLVWFLSRIRGIKNLLRDHQLVTFFCGKTASWFIGIIDLKVRTWEIIFWLDK